MSDREKFRLFKTKYMENQMSPLTRKNLKDQIDALKDYVPEEGCVLGNHKLKPISTSRVCSEELDK